MLAALNATLPPMIVARMPVDFCLSLRAPVGRSCSMVGISGAIVAGSKMLRSAIQPCRNRPRIGEPPRHRRRQRDHPHAFSSENAGGCAPQ